MNSIWHKVEVHEHVDFVHGDLGLIIYMVYIKELLNGNEICSLSCHFDSSFLVSYFYHMSLSIEQVFV